MMLRIHTCLFFLVASAAHAQLTISFDYSRDTAGFFTESRKGALEAAGSYLTSIVTGPTLAAINPTYPNHAHPTLDGDSWRARISHPTTLANTDIHNRAIAQDSIVIYVGGSSSLGSTLASGSQANTSTASDGFTWDQIVVNRGRGTSAGTMPSIGAISFNNTTNWYFDSDASTIESFSGYDFFSVAVHEMIHVLGVLNAPGRTWKTKTNLSNQFTGTNSITLYGQNVPLHSDGAHWAAGVSSLIAGTSLPQSAIMVPTIGTGTRRFITDLDLAGLTDIGYVVDLGTATSIHGSISAIPEPSTYAATAGVGVFCAALWMRSKRKKGVLVPRQVARPRLFSGQYRPAAHGEYTPNR